MSAFDANPFADPVDVNPFQDPSVTQLTNPQGGLAEFNPFSENPQLTNASATTIPATQPAGPSQPAVLQPSVEPTPQAVASAAQANLLKQQEELERKAAELDRKERELQRSAASLNVRPNNWPPLPSGCPIKPCFYQDFSAEIPADYQRICKMMYYLWMLHSVTLFLNLLACLAWFTTKEEGTSFGLSILWFVLFTPCAFICWYRPIYKAFRSDNSFNFFVFFFVFFCQVVVYIIQVVGIPGLGTSGWIVAFSTTKSTVPILVSIIMMVVAVCFTLCAVLSIILLKRVHSMYRRTGASFQQAQEEFSQGIFTSRIFRNTASAAATSAARGTFQGN